MHKLYANYYPILYKRFSHLWFFMSMGVLEQAEQYTYDGPTFLPKLLSPLGAQRCGPAVRRQISGIFRQTLGLNLISKPRKKFIIVKQL